MNRVHLFFACSGPGAQAIIAENIAIGAFSAMIGAVIASALVYDWVRTGRMGFTMPAAVLLLMIHPAWTVGGLHGDCGFRLRELSRLSAVAHFVFLILRYVFSKRPLKTRLGG